MSWFGRRRSESRETPHGLTPEMETDIAYMTKMRQLLTEIMVTMSAKFGSCRRYEVKWDSSPKLKTVQRTKCFLCEKEYSELGPMLEIEFRETYDPALICVDREECSNRVYAQLEEVRKATEERKRLEREKEEVEMRQMLDAVKLRTSAVPGE